MVPVAGLCASLRNGRREAIGQDGRSHLEGDRAFHGIFELADIAGPVVVQQVHRLPRHDGDRFSHLLAVLDEEVLRQQGDVAPLRSGGRPMGITLMR